MNTAEIAQRANTISRLSTRRYAGRLTEQSTRDDLIAWLCWADRNGIWTDAECVAEQMDPMTTDDAWDHVRRMSED